MVALLVLVLFAAVLPFTVWLAAVPEPWTYLEPGVPPGQILYVISKLAGLIAIALFTLQIVLTLIRHRKFKILRGLAKYSLHYWLGIITFITILIHIGLFALAASVRAESWMVQLLLPNWHGFYNSMVSLGVIAFYLSCVLVLLGLLLKFALLRKNGVHKLLATICGGLIFVHSFAIGSETHEPAVRFFYLLLALMMALGVVSKLVNRTDSSTNAAKSG